MGELGDEEWFLPPRGCAALQPAVTALKEIHHQQRAWCRGAKRTSATPPATVVSLAPTDQLARRLRNIYRQKWPLYRPFLTVAIKTWMQEHPPPLESNDLWIHGASNDLAWNQLRAVWLLILFRRTTSRYPWGILTNARTRLFSNWSLIDQTALKIID